MAEQLHENRNRSAIAFVLLVSLVTLSLLILKPVFSNHKEMSEEIVVKVIDKKTKKAQQNIDVKVSYIVAEGTPGGGSYHTLKSVDARTGVDGTFRVTPIAKPRPVNLLIYVKKYWGTFYTLSKGGKILSHEHVPVSAGGRITFELADSVNDTQHTLRP